MIKVEGTRNALGIEYGDIITVDTHLGPVTGMVAKLRSGWTLTNHNANGHLPPWGNATRIILITKEG